MKISFTLYGPPRPMPRPRFSRRGFAYTPKKVKIEKQEFILKVNKHKPQEMITCPVRLTISFMMPIPKSTTHKDRAKMNSDIVPHIKKPDIDNLVKFVMDGLTNAGFWKNDSNVWVIYADKRYDSKSRTIITITGDSHE